MKNYIKARVAEIENKIILIRREIHKNPELSFCEGQTAELICRQLEALGIEYKSGVAGTGVVGIIRGRSDNGKTLLMRADMDALPVQEKNDVPYRSENEGVMHACGHDFHTAVLLGAAEVLNSMSDKFDGNIKLVFQPGEETTGGAEPMIKAGVMKNPDVTAAVACHVWPEAEVGTVKVKYGAVTASPDEFYITVTGSGGHGAKPELAISPIDMGSVLVQRLQELPRKCFGAMTPALVSVCQIGSGSCPNVIPAELKLSGTFRSFDPEVRRKLGVEIEKTAVKTVEAMGGKCDVRIEYLFPSVINNEKMVDLMMSLNPDVRVEWLAAPSMAGEDFAFFANEVPSVLACIGTKNEKLNNTKYPVHNPNFDIDERATGIAVELLSCFAVNYLSE